MVLLCLREHFTLRALVRGAALRVELGDALEAAVRRKLGLFAQELSTAAPPAYGEVVPTPFAAGGTEDTPARPTDKELAFLGVPLFLTRVVAPLFWDVRLGYRQGRATLRGHLWRLSGVHYDDL